MLTKTTVNGKAATVCFLNDKWEPVPEKDATKVKVMFDEGGILFGAVTSSGSKGKG